MFDREKLEGLSAGASRVSLNFNRKGDEFAPTLFANPKPGVDLPLATVEEMREMVDWALGHGFFVWLGRHGWLPSDAPAADAARAFCEALGRPVERVTVVRAAPTPERPGWEPHGQVTLQARIRGVDVDVATAATSIFDHDTIEARFVADGQSLAAAYGVPCEVT